METNLMKIKWILLYSILIVVANCHQDASILEPKNDIIKVHIQNSETYQRKLGVSGDEEGATIRKQALQFQTSKILRNSDTNWEAVYIYQPKENYRGIDYVEIELSGGSDGASPPTNKAVIKIQFIIDT
jgi:hypothetical protein